MHVPHRHRHAVGTLARPFVAMVFLATLFAALIPLVAQLLADDGGAAGFVGWTLPLVRASVHLSNLAVIAVLCIGVLLPVGDSEQLTPFARRLGRRGSGAALAAVVACSVLLLWTYFEVLGAGPLRAGFEDFGTFLDELASGRALLAQIGFLLLSAMLAWIARSVTALRMALFLAVAGTTTLALGGHAASDSGHSLAMFSMTAHLAAASVWVGGLAGLAWLAVSGSDVLHSVARRFSRLALICATVVAVSGIVSAVVRVPDVAALAGSPYGWVLLLKVVALAVLIAVGASHRRRLLAGASFSRPDFVRLAGGELVVMGAAYGLAIALVGLEPPVVG